MPKKRPSKSASTAPQDNELMVQAFAAYAAARIAGAADKPEKGRPATDPNAFYHGLDRSLHTIAHESVQPETVQHFRVESGDRWQYVSKDRRLSFICDLEEKGRVTFQSFDMVFRDKRSTTFASAAEATNFFDRGEPGHLSLSTNEQDKAVKLGAETWLKLGDATAHRTVTKAAAELAKLGAGWAIVELYGIHIVPTRYAKRRQEARSLLEDLARSRGLTIEAMLDASIPPAVPAGAEERFAVIESRRLERFMVDGARFSFSEARSRFFQQPPVLAVTSRIIWGAVAKDGRASAWLWGNGGPHDVDGHNVTLADDAEIGVLHPLELGQDVIRWRQTLAAQEITQPFLQLERPLHLLTESQKASNVITDFKRYDREWLVQQDWWGFKKDADYMSDVDTFAVIMARDDHYIEAPLDGTGRLAAVVMGKAKETRAAYEYVASTKATFGSLHPVSQSELLYAFLGPGKSGARAGATSVSASTAVRGGPSRPAGTGMGQQPFVEPAKTGRSTCVVCGEKIEKDTLRVAIEREIDTPQFKGRGNVYVHAKQSCMAGCPELKDFRLDPKT